MVNKKNTKTFHPKLPPIHPGEILRERILIPRDISPQQLAQILKVPKEQIKWVCEERADITPTLAAHLAFHLDSTVDFWLNLQHSYEEELAKEELELLKKEVVPYQTKRENRRHASVR